MPRDQYTVKETDRLLNHGIDHGGTYSVSRISEKSDVVGYAKIFRRADASLVWECGHVHPSWNDAAECRTTILNGGQPLQP